MRYPLFLDLTGQSAVVIGAGSVATRKIRTLLRANAAVTVISPQATVSIRRFAQRKRVRWVRRRYRPGDLRAARLAIAATDNPAVNRSICMEAKRRNLLVNCITSPAEGNFLVPSLVRRGGISLAISTNGANPAFAKLLRRDLEHFLGHEYPQLLKAMSAARHAKKA
jgi:precorrin-2 dehydrogenase/sirohydrochlorin ferrochelatase